MQLSRRGLSWFAALLGSFTLACRDRQAPDTELPTEQLGPHFRKLRRRIRKHVREPERRAAALALVECMDERLESVGLLLVDWRTDLAMLSDDAGKTVVLAMTRSYSERLGDVARDVGRLAFQLRRHITAEEWPRVFPTPEREQEPEPC